MDSMKVESGMMRGVVSKLISAFIKKQYGIEAKIDLKSLSVDVRDDKIYISTAIEAEASTDILLKVNRIA